MAENPSKAEITRRVSDIFPLVLSCVRTREIYRFVSAKTDWGHVCTRTIDRYIARCNVIITKSSVIDHDHEIGGARSRLRDLYARASARGDLGECRMIQKDLTALFGLAAPTKIEVEVTDAERKEVEEMLTREILAEAERIARSASEG